MTQVVSLVTNAVQLAVGQSWETNDRKKYWINKIELLPDLNALGGNTRITAIDDFIRILHQPLYHMKLLLNTRIMPNQLDTETWRNHRQTAQAP